MLRLWILVVTAFLASPCASAQSETGQDEAAITSKMSSLVGTGAYACGLIKQHSALRQAWKCAQTQDSKHIAFWLAVEGHHTDSSVWHIVARAPSGERYIIFYTSNNFGQSSFAPSFTISPCHHSFKLREGGLFLFGCGKDAP